MMAEFSIILQSLLSPNNEERVEAERQYNTLGDADKLRHLIHTIRNSQVVEIRTIASVLLRRFCVQSGPDGILKLPEDILSPCQSELLVAVQQEPNATVRRKIAEAVAEMARACIDDDDNNHWPMGLKFLFECCNPQAPHLYEVALNIIIAVPGIFANQQQHYFAVIKQMLRQAMSHPHKEVKTAAFKATVSVLKYQQTDKIRSHFVDLLPLMLQIVQDCVQEAANDSVLQSLVDLCTECPTFIRPHFDIVMKLCVKVAGTETMEESWRHLSLEVIISVAENAPGMFRKYGKKYIPDLIIQALNFMLDITDDEDWSRLDELEDADESSNESVGQGALNRLALSLGGRAILQHIMTTLPAMFQSNDWKHRHTALMAVGVVAEGCYKEMQKVLDQVVEFTFPFCRDSHHRVRYAACNALGQMSIDFPIDFQTKYHHKVCPALLAVLDDFNNPRVQAHACAALVNFIDHCPRKVLVKYVDAIMDKVENIFTIKLKELLEKGTKLVLEQVVTTTATVADTGKDLFVAYYNRFMPSLKYIVANATAKDYRNLRGKTIECISLIGLAVGAEKFMQDASDVMALLLKVQTEQGMDMEPDDPQVSYMMSAWGRMCKLLGQDFVQYLPIVMPPLLKVAGSQPQITIVDSVDAEEAYNQDGGWEFITLADHQRLGVWTAGLDDKYTACQMLVVYARDLGEGFADYVEAVVNIMLPMLRFVFYDMVRVAAAEILPYLIQDISVKGAPAVRSLWSQFAGKLIDALRIEVDSDVWAVMADSLIKCIELLGPNCFSVEQYKDIAGIIKMRLEVSFERAQDRLEERQGEDYDEEVEEDLSEEDKIDEQYLSKIADIMHCLFKTHRSQILPFFEELVPIFAGMVEENRSAVDRQWALCVFDDLIEFAAEHAPRYERYFLQSLLKGICAKEAGVRQASAFGIGVMAQFAGDHFSQHCLEALPLLVLAIQDPSAKADFTSSHARENAIAAVTKICKYLKSGVPYQTILPIWLSWLPVVKDKVEAQYTYGYLCDLIQSQNPYVLGPDNQNIPQIMSIFATALCEDALSHNLEVQSRVLAILRHIKSSQNVWMACLQYLSEEQRQALTTALG